MSYLQWNQNVGPSGLEGFAGASGTRLSKQGVREHPQGRSRVPTRGRTPAIAKG